MYFNKLTIVSDTSLFESNGKYYGFGPVVRELEYIDDCFDEIIWIGYRRDDLNGDLSMQKINSPKIKVIFLDAIGGKGIASFLKVLLHYPRIGITIYKHIRNADIVHTRAPSHPALIGALWSFVLRKKVWWHKYAGNWSQVNPPKAYGFQRWLFKKATHTSVTINGFWPDQSEHCYSFENPCLTDSDIELGTEIASAKQFEPPFVFSFVGRLEDAKGVTRIIEALQSLPFEKIGEVHFVGDGVKTDTYRKMASFLGEKVTFHGFLDKDGVHSILKKSHFFLLPSTASEGFPKVISEAACYGAIPIVSNVSSIPHYINDSNGFIWSIEDKTNYSDVLQKSIQSDKEQLEIMSKNILEVAQAFTFSNYLRKLKKYVFKLN